MSKDLQPFWEDLYPIHSFWSDPHHRVKVSALLNMFQESAWHHAEHLGVGFQAFITKGLIWVLSRLQLKMYAYPTWGEKVIVRTWPSGRDRLYCYRDFLILDEQGQVKGEAASTWFAVDVKSRRPQPTQLYYPAEIPNTQESVFSRRPPKLPGEILSDPVFTTRVGWNDLDANQHTNNVRYVDWIINSFDGAFLKTHLLKELCLNFRSESLLGERVGIRLLMGEERKHRTQVFRLEDHQILCQAELKWENLSVQESE